MTGGILRDLANAAEFRRESKKSLIQAAQRLAKRIAETARVGDSVHLNNRVYSIENASWTLTDTNGKTYESPHTKTLALHTGSWEMSVEGEVSDSRRMVSLIDLTPTGTGPVDSSPHLANVIEIRQAEQDGFYDIEGFGPTDFEKPSIYEYEIFAAEAESVLKGFIRSFEEQGNIQRQEADRLNSLTE